MKFLAKVKTVLAEDNHPLNQKFDDLKINIEAAMEDMLEFLGKEAEGLDQNVFTKGGGTAEKIKSGFQKAYDWIHKQ